MKRRETLRVMSYNIQGHAVLKRQRHLSQVATVIHQLRPDVIGLQEVHKNTHRLRTGDQLADLASATGLELFFGRSMARGPGEYGNAVLVRGSITAGRVHPLPGRGEPRSLLECSLEAAGYALTVFVTHLSAWFNFSRGTRREQITTLKTVIDAASGPLLLLGDFNTPPDSAEMRDLIRSERLKLCGERAEVTHQLSRRRLDYIFSGPEWRTRAAWAVPLGPSDHWPLVADLELDDESA